LESLKKSFKISGRARRKEYWLFRLFDTLAVILLIILGISIASFFENVEVVGVILGSIVLIYAIISTIATLTAGIRRLHDLGKSG
jgi:uncharacterized membrane protein YhaH (DUF805 family)